MSFLQTSDKIFNTLSLLFKVDTHAPFGLDRKQNLSILLI